MKGAHKQKQKPEQRIMNEDSINRGEKKKKGEKKRNSSCTQSERRNGNVSETSINFHIIIMKREKSTLASRKTVLVVLVTRSVFYSSIIHMCMYAALTHAVMYNIQCITYEDTVLCEDHVVHTCIYQLALVAHAQNTVK